MPNPSARASQITKAATPVGVRTQPKKNDLLSRGRSGKENIPARRRWTQGYGTIKANGRVVVPFATEATCRRVAADAQTRIGKPMIIFQHQDLWCYREEKP